MSKEKVAGRGRNGDAIISEFRQRLEERLAELKRVKRVKNVRANLGNGASGEALDRLAGMFPGINERVLDFYRSVNGVYLGWSYWQRRVPLFTGSLFLKSVERSLAGEDGGEDGVWKETFSAVPQKGGFSLQRGGPLIEFETVDGMDMSVYVDVTAAGTLPELFLREEDSVFPLTVSFTEYLRLMLRTLGLYHWYHLLTDPAYYELSPGQYRDFRRYLELALPGVEEPALERDFDDD